MTVAVFAGLAEGDLAAEEIAHKLHAIANAEDGDAEFKDIRVRMRRGLCVNTLRAAGEDDADHAFRAELRGRRAEMVDLRVDLALADAARDDLGELGTEIEDGDGLCHAGVRTNAVPESRQEAEPVCETPEWTWKSRGY